MTGYLKVKGTKIVDSDSDEPVVLKGTAIGGHLNMENFITGYAGHETEHKRVLAKKIGQEKTDYFFDKFYEYFWTESDAFFYSKELNFNCLRIPFNYRHFLNDEGDLFEINPNGFKRLDSIINSCSKYGIYTILDLHAVPGGQNQNWHSDSSIHKALFWEFKVFQDAIVNLWCKIADYYKDNKWIAGFNPLNEPAVSDHSKLVAFYQRLDNEIRKFDTNHILFLDGNTYASDFTQFPSKPLENAVYSIHDYSKFGFPHPKGKLYKGDEEQKSKLKQQYLEKISFHLKNQVPVWNGEFGPVYASESRGDENVEIVNKARYQVLKDQLEIYKTGDPSGDSSPISWSIWLYKDVGLQGLTYVDPNSKFFKIFGDFILRKKELGLDRWGKDIKPEYQPLYTNLTNHFKQQIPKKYHDVLYPPHWDIEYYIGRATRDTLLSQYFEHVYADLFVGLTFEELDELAASYKFENVIKRNELNEILRN